MCESFRHQSVEIFSNYMPILFIEKGLETICSWRFIRVHGHDSIPHLSNGHRLNELLPITNRNRRSSSLHYLISNNLHINREKVSKKQLGCLRQFLHLRAPNTIPNEHAMNFIPFPPDNGLGMKKPSIAVTEAKPRLPRFLIPQQLFL